MVWSNIHFLPISSFLILPLTFITTYVISIIKNDTTIFFPYISDTGNNVPESCIFSQFVNLSTFLFGFTIYIRYKQIEQYYRDHLSSDSPEIFKINYFALIFGLISCFGLSVVANFQEKNLRAIHLSGAITCFTFGLLYCSLQTWMSFNMYPLVNSFNLFIIRFLLTFFMFIFYLNSLILGPIALKNFHGKDRSKWLPTDGGYYLHMIAAISEWLTAFCLNFFLLSYTGEMYKISVSPPSILILIKDNNLIENSQNENENSLYQIDNVAIIS